VRAAGASRPGGAANFTAANFTTGGGAHFGPANCISFLNIIG
jgi:hypothetical protein